MAAVLSEKGRAVLDLFHAATGMQADGMADEWRAMDEREREFWLKVSRLSTRYATTAVWFALPGDVRATLKNNLYRAAQRARQIIGAAGAAAN